MLVYSVRERGQIKRNDAIIELNRINTTVFATSLSPTRSRSILPYPVSPFW